MFSRRCRVLTLEVLLLVVIGIVMVASSSRVWAEYKFDDPFYYAWRQGIFALIGLGCMFVCAHIPIRLLRKHARLLFWLSTATLVLVLIPGLVGHRELSHPAQRVLQDRDHPVCV